MPDTHPFPDEFSPVGSSVFYAIRFAPPCNQSSLSLVNAFYRTVRSIPLTCTDPGVAAEKLNWWQQEMKRSRLSQAQHPVARSMGRLEMLQILPDDYFDPLFQAIGREIGAIQLENDTDLETHCRQTGAVFTDLYARISGANPEQRESARELGVFLRMVEIIRDLGFDLRRSRCFIPLDRLQQHRLSATQLLLEDQEKLQALLSSITTLHLQRYQKTLNALSSRNGLGPVLSMAAMAERVLHVIQSDDYRRLRLQRTSLTPLHKLWISWRCQRSIR